MALRKTANQSWNWNSFAKTSILIFKPPHSCMFPFCLIYTIPKAIPTARSADTISLTYSFLPHGGETHITLSGAFLCYPGSRHILWKEKETRRVYLTGNLECPFEPKHTPASNSTIREPFVWIFRIVCLFVYQNYSSKIKYPVRT